VGDAAVDQQLHMREAFVGFANLVSSSARQVNAKWPLFRIPDFELHTGQLRLQSGAEIIGCNYLIEPNEEEEYLEFVTANYEDSLIEGHMTRYGNLDRLTPIGYTPNFTTIGATGFVPDTMNRTLRFAFWQLSPRKYIVIVVWLLPDNITIHLCD
jgi:hypothetical protein